MTAAKDSAEIVNFMPFFAKMKDWAIRLAFVLIGAAVAQQLPANIAAATTKLPVQTSPGAGQSPAPGSARAAQCRKMADELGLSGTRRTQYLATCTRR